jgi:hypothetical protein
MKRIVWMVAGAALLGAAGISAMRMGSPQTDAQAAAHPADEAAVQRGGYLVKIMGCNDCHTPFKMGPKGPEPDMSRMLSGHPEQIGPLQPAVQSAAGPWVWSGAGTNTAFSGPWGVSYTANLTPDQNTGLGIWTEDMFIQTIRTGRHMGVSRPINPPMPWPMYRNATDADLKAIYAYLRSIKPITNHVPEYVPPSNSN